MFNNIRQRYSATVRFGGGMAGQGLLCIQLSPWSMWRRLRRR